LADYRFREFWLLLLILITSTSIILIVPKVNNSGGMYFENMEEDVADTEETAKKINEGQYIGTLNRISDYSDFYKIYLDYGDKIRITFSKN